MAMNTQKSFAIDVRFISDGNVKTMGDASVFLGDDDLGFGGLVVDKNGNFVIINGKKIYGLHYAKVIGEVEM